MKYLSWLLAFLLLAGCSQVSRTPFYPETTQSVPFDGDAVAAALLDTYNDVSANCGSASRPAFLCSGVLLRGTNESHNYHSWNPVPGRTGVAFSYLRKDAKFDHLAVGTDNGFILYPILSGPIGKWHMQVLCSFPIDGNTGKRAQPGCGASGYFPESSGRCQSQGITTASEWKAHFDSLPDDRPMETWVYSYVCGFDVSDGMNEQGAGAFYQSLQAMQLVPASLWHHYNELMIEAWPQDIPDRLPIRAFFYTLPSGLVGARHDQWDFFRSTRVFIPIVHMQLPELATGDAMFSYNPQDQYCQPEATSC